MADMAFAVRLRGCNANQDEAHGNCGHYKVLHHFQSIRFSQGIERRDCGAIEKALQAASTASPAPSPNMRQMA